MMPCVNPLNTPAARHRTTNRSIGLRSEMNSTTSSW